MLVRRKICIIRYHTLLHIHTYIHTYIHNTYSIDALYSTFSCFFLFVSFKEGGKHRCRCWRRFVIHSFLIFTTPSFPFLSFPFLSLLFSIVKLTRSRFVWSYFLHSFIHSFIHSFFSFFFFFFSYLVIFLVESYITWGRFLFDSSAKDGWMKRRGK